MKIATFGAGAWGTALAVGAAPRHAVTLWARDPRQAEAMARTRENAAYLPGLRLAPGIALAGDAAWNTLCALSQVPETKHFVPGFAE